MRRSWNTGNAARQFILNMFTVLSTCGVELLAFVSDVKSTTNRDCVLYIFEVLRTLPSESYLSMSFKSLLTRLQCDFNRVAGMISTKLLRGSLSASQSIASVDNIMFPRLSTCEVKENFVSNNILNISSRNISTSDPFRQSAPLLTPRTPRKNSNLRKAEAGLPSKPKKPETTWIAFVRDNKEKYLKQKPMIATELTTLLSKEWQIADKSRYEQEYLWKREEYRQAIESYKNSLTDEQRAVIKINKSLKKESKAMKILRHTKPPVLTRNPANLYCVERCKEPDIKERLKHEKSSLVLRDLFADYRNLSDSEREKYVEMQQKDKLRFQHEFHQWYDRIKSDPSLSKTVHDKANTLHARFKALNWI